MTSEYKLQFREKGQLMDYWTNIPANKKEMLHNKFKGQGNYAILDELVGGNGSILTRYNSHCKKNGMPCFVKCCSNNEDCGNVRCASDGRPDGSRFSTSDCIFERSHAILDPQNRTSADGEDALAKCEGSPFVSDDAKVFPTASPG